MYTILTTETFDRWFKSIEDRTTKARIQARLDRAEDGNFGQCRSVGDGVTEMKIDFGSGYRIYFVRRGVEIIVLLAGGDKSTQQDDIRLARALVRQL